MNKKIDNVWSGKLITLSNKLKTLCKVFSILIILYRSLFVKVFEKNLIGGLFIMEKREKVKQIYNKFGIIVGEDYIDGIMENKERLEGMIRLYKEEEIDSMNYIFGKNDDNKHFTELETEIASKIDLFDRQIIKVCKNIWENRDNEESLNSILKQLKVGVSKCI